MIVGILLAAGSAHRFGGDKLLHPLDDGTPVAIAAARHLQPACDRTLAVVRPGHAALIHAFQALGVPCVPCPAAQAGMGHSLACGVQAAPDATGWIVALADMPWIATATHRTVADALRRGASLAAASHRAKRGHPVGFAAHWRSDLVRLEGDEGARQLLQAQSAALALCEVDDPGIFQDVDTPADLGRGA